MHHLKIRNGVSKADIISKAWLVTSKAGGRYINAGKRVSNTGYNG